MSEGRKTRGPVRVAIAAAAILAGGLGMWWSGARLLGRQGDAPSDKAAAQPSSDAQGLSCSNTDLVMQTIKAPDGRLLILELTNPNQVLDDRAHATIYCTARAVTSRGAGPVSYRLHLSSDGEAIVEAKEGADGFHTQLATQLGKSPQDLDGMSDDQLRAAGAVAELNAAVEVAQAEDPGERVIRPFRTECQGRLAAMWIKGYSLTPEQKVARIDKLTQTFHSVEQQSPNVITDDDRKCAAELEGASAFLQSGGSYETHDHFTNSAMSIAPPQPAPTDQ